MRLSASKNLIKQAGIALPVLLMLLGLTIAAAAAAAGGTWFFMHKSKPAQGETKVEKKQPPPDPTFVTIDPMTVNLQDNSGQVLYAGISLQVVDEKTADEVKAHLPQVRNRILIELSDQRAPTLTTRQGKKALATALRRDISRPYTDHGEPLPIQDVLFTNFIVQ